MCCCFNDSTNPKFSTKLFIDSELVPSEDKAEPALKLYARVSRVIFDIWSDTQRTDALDLRFCMCVACVVVLMSTTKLFIDSELVPKSGTRYFNYQV